MASKLVESCMNFAWRPHTCHLRRTGFCAEFFTKPNQTSFSDFLFKMFTRLEILELFPWDVLKLAS